MDTTSEGGITDGVADSLADVPLATVDPAQIHVLSAIHQGTPVAVCITTEDGRFEQVNPAYERLYGYPADELIGRHFTMVVPEDQRQQLSELHDRFIAQGAEMRGEWQAVAKDGSERTILADACRIVGPDGRFRKVTFVLDISDRIAIERQLAQANELLEAANLQLTHLATHDSLTGLANYRRSQEALAAAIYTARRYGRELVVAVVDLDHFKEVNDTHGHRAGDEALIQFATMLRDGTRAADICGRLGGEEFLVVMPETSTEEARVIFSRLRQDCRERPLTPSGQRLTFSAGLARFCYDDTPEALLGRADAALYRAKSEGRDRTVVG